MRENSMLIADICEDLRECHAEFALESIGRIKNLMENILEEYEEILDRVWPGELLQECPESIEIKFVFRSKKFYCA